MQVIYRYLCGNQTSLTYELGRPAMRLRGGRSERWEAWLPIAGGALTAAVFIALPTYFYMGRLPRLGDCGEDLSRYT
jgi:hypothetical protein